MTKSRHSPAIALTATALLAGCHFIKVNGKPLGGTSASPSSPSSSSPSPEATPASGTAEAPPAEATPPPARAGGETTATGAAPELCTEYKIYERGDYSPAEFADVKTDEDSASSVASRFASMMCTSGKVSNRDKIMAIRASWMKVLGLDEQDFVVLVAKSRNLSWDSQDESKLPGPIGQVGRNAELLDLDHLGARASMYSRFAVAEDCLLRIGGATLLQEVLCSREKLDAAKAYAEIDSVEEVNQGTRYRLRRMVKTTAERVTKIRTELAAKAKEEPGLAKVIAIADARFKEWESPSPARAKLLDQLAAMEAATKANKYSAFKGCEAKTRASWEQHLATLALPKVPSDQALGAYVTATMGTADGYLAYQAFRLCTAGNAGTSFQRSEIVGPEAIRRGPRTATIAAWIAATADIKFDDRNTSMSSLMVAAGFLPPYAYRGNRQRQGVIGKIEKRETGGVKVSFKDVIEPREACLKERETNRIVALRSDGSPIYRRDCVKWGMVKMNLTADPLFIDEGMAHGLKPGMYLVGIDGVAIVATSRPKSAKPTWVFGGAVK